MTAERSDDLGHPLPAVASFDDFNTIVHSLQRYAVAFVDVACPSYLGHRVDVGAQKCGSYPLGFVVVGDQLQPRFGLP
jgi:hypothetical protein